VEAVIGAAFLDGGFEAAERIVERLFDEPLRKTDPRTSGKDAKTQLQEFLQSRRLPLPRYSVITVHGEAHDQLFEVECEIAPLRIRSTGTGPSRRSAEQEAARAAYEQASNT
jgi:ribonuclease-3